MPHCKPHILIAGAWGYVKKEAINKALTCRSALFEQDPRSSKVRISMVADSIDDFNDFVFEYQELFDNSYWRVVDLRGDTPKVKLHHPQYEGQRKEFVDVEWEFIVGHISNQTLQGKLKRWSCDAKRHLTIVLGYDDAEKNMHILEKLQLRLSEQTTFEIRHDNPEFEKEKMEQWMEMAKYLHYFYQASYELKHVPTELPEDEVNKAWNEIKDEKIKLSNLYNVMSIPGKMEILGHDRNDWNTFYALTAAEIEELTAIEHNRWCVERLIQGMRPCTEDERKEIENDLQKRLSDEEYAKTHPESLKKKYKNGRNAHYDLCAYTELGIDETGLPVTRYDRDLTAAIPLIVNYLRK